MNVNSRGSDPVILESQCQGSLVDETPAGRVDQEGSRSHLLDGVLVNKMVIVQVKIYLMPHRKAALGSLGSAGCYSGSHCGRNCYCLLLVLLL